MVPPDGGTFRCVRRINSLGQKAGGHLELQEEGASDVVGGLALQTLRLQYPLHGPDQLRNKEEGMLRRVGSLWCRIFMCTTRLRN